MNKILLSNLIAISFTTTLQASDLSIEIVPDEVIKGVVLPHLNDQDVGERFGYTNKRYFDLTEKELAERLVTASPEELGNIAEYRYTIAAPEALNRLTANFFPLMQQAEMDNATQAPVQAYMEIYTEYQLSLVDTVTYDEGDTTFPVPITIRSLPFFEGTTSDVLHVSVPDVMGLNQEQIILAGQIIQDMNVSTLGIHVLGAENNFPNNMNALMNAAGIPNAFQAD